jgi:4-hydroxy-3-polyprenylbenzoate decarboxylase
MASASQRRGGDRRFVVAITGATGAVYGVRLLEHLRAMPGVETHLVISDAATLTLHQETGLQRRDLELLSHVVHKTREIGASIASGSFTTDGMVIAPCSMKTLAAVAHGLSDNLITRAADVILKERRRLILMVRETPFNLAHLRNMTAVTEMGGIVFPPLPSFYNRPATIEEMVDHSIARVLDLLGVENGLAPRWAGMRGTAAQGTT